MKRAAAIALLVLAGCGSSSGLEGTLQWNGEPRIKGRTVTGLVKNTTSEPVTLDEQDMRFLTDDGRSIDANTVRIGDAQVDPGRSTRIEVSWKGKTTPTRLDYGAGTLTFP